MLNLLMIISIVSFCHATVENARGDVSSRCEGARTACAAGKMTRYPCRSTWHAFQMDMIRADTNNDCEVDGDDMVKNYRDNYNLEDDDKICKREWITRSTNFFGLSSAFSHHLFDTMYPSGCGDLDEVEDLDKSMKLKTDYLNSAIQHLVSFCGKVDHSNIDCWNLPVICKEKAPHLPACSKFDRGHLTLWDKLQMYQSANDPDNDGIVTYKEMNTNLRTNFDRDNDGCVSRQEFTHRWTTYFRFSRRLADTLFSMRDVNADNCIMAGDMNIPSSGKQAHTFPANLIKIIIGICENNKSYYGTMQECTQVADTCRTHFANLRECREHYASCGIDNYLSCVEPLPDSVCGSEADLYEIKFEKLKIYNLINQTCTAELMNGSQRISGGFVFALLPMILAVLAWR